MVAGAVRQAGAGHGRVISGGGLFTPSLQEGRPTTWRQPAGPRRAGLSAAALARRGGNAAAGGDRGRGGGGRGQRPAPPRTVRGCGRQGLLRGGLGRAGRGQCERPARPSPFCPGRRGLGSFPRGVLGSLKCRLSVRAARSVSFLIKKELAESVCFPGAPLKSPDEA